MRRNSAPIVAFVVVLLLVIAIIAAVAWAVSRNKSAAGTPVPSSGNGDTAAMVKPDPVTKSFKGCPASGDGGDPKLNTLKNRIDEAPWQPVTISALLSLDWPRSIEYQPRSKWSRDDAAAIAMHEGAPVQAEGYLVSAKRTGPESCNCHSVDNIDFHIWMVDDPSKGREQSVVIEASPPVRSYHSAWSLSNIQKIANNKQKVRISGWLMMDPEHPDQIGKTRGTIWEIHPVMQIETLSGGVWKPLDNGTTGVSSMPDSSNAAPQVTVESTAPPPSADTPGVQYNETVQIDKVFANGVKGQNEPDEYVEIINRGDKQVNMADWSLQDPQGNDVFKWEQYTIQPGATIRVYTNEVHGESGGFSFGSSRAVWNNSGGVAELYDADKELVSRFGYGTKK